MIVSRIFTAYYFIHFLVILPVLGLVERPKPLPASIADAVLAKGGATVVAGASAPQTKG